MFEPTVIVHGGARDIPNEVTQHYLDGVKAAARQGHAMLKRGGSAMDAAVEAVSVLEDDPIFNAGQGSVLNLAGEVEQDALVVDGRNLDAGAVCGLRGCQNPIHVARLVMDKTKHCLLSGRGANDFMGSQGITRVPKDDLVTPKARAEWERYMNFSSATDSLLSTRSAPDPPSDCDTVGAVAMDAQGHLAAATSTGGTTAKLPGRVGDSPIIGSGAYADNQVGAVSTTGHGESIMKICLARRVGELLEKGYSAQQAAQDALGYMGRRVGGAAGVIVLSKGGDDGRCQVVRHFTTTRMSWAVAGNGQLKWGIDPEQEESVSLDD